MKQSKFMSMLETVLSTAAGFSISLLAQWYFLPKLGVTISFEQNVFFAVIMTVVSLARGYVMRRLFEAFNIRRPLSPAMLAIIAERFRQIEVEGWDAAHDDAHADGSLAQAAAAYAIGAEYVTAYNLDQDEEYLINGRELFPWDIEHWKPRERRRNLVRAGALIVAELDRGERRRHRSRA